MTHPVLILLLAGLAAAAASALAQTPEAERREEARRRYEAMTPEQKAAAKEAAIKQWQAMSPEEKAAAAARIKERAAADMHSTLEATARQANAQEANKRLDAYTTLKGVSYDRSVPVFTYHYTSTQLFDEAGRRAIYEHHRKTVCGSHFATYMQLHGLRVARRFADASTGRELAVATVSWKDCPS